ncbi:MAG TPA: thioesterase family protein [Kofleriaceae bacterium]|nr:thioesterase family protein [Kofleriaceae bacterium]
MSLVTPEDPEPVDFDRLITPAQLAPGRFSIDVPDRWQQGRGAFGGLVLAMLERAAESAAADPSRQLRSLSAQIVGPVQPGPAEISVEILRAGSGVTAAAARLVQEGAVQAHAVAVLGKPRATYDSPATLPPPQPPPWRQVTPIPVSVAVAPVFSRHFELRPTGVLPFSGADAQQGAAGWVRLRHPGRARDGAFVIALIDSYWPGFLAAASSPRPAATLAFSLEPMSDLDGLDPDAPLFYRARVLGGRDGYAIEARELWGEDGRLVALNQQLFVVIK